MTEEALRGSDQLSVFLRAWAPRGAPRGVVGIVHGLGEHSGPSLGSPDPQPSAAKKALATVLAFIAGWMEKHLA